MKQKFSVGGMTCASCQAHVEKAVAALNGVSSVNVNLLSGTMTVEYENISDSDICSAVSNAGYSAAVYSREQTSAAAPKPSDSARKAASELKRRFIVSVCFLVPLMYVAMFSMLPLPVPQFITDTLSGWQNALNFALTQLILLIPIAVINQKYFINGYKSLFHRSPNMDSLIAVGSTAAIVYGIFAMYRMSWGLGHSNMELVHSYMHDIYFESAGTILTLITLGKWLESRSKSRTGEAVEKLMELAPKTANVIRDGVEITIPAEQLVCGDIIVIRPGERIPADGVISEGSSSVDFSALTGESIPADVEPGDRVMTAAVNINGSFRMQADKVGTETTLSKIIALVEDAGSSKAPIARLADKISGVFVPAVMIIALAAALIWFISGAGVEFSISIGIAVLVISCPCALGLATPVAIMVGTGKGAENGILFKSAEALEQLGKVNAVILDKTGTITEGKPAVTDVIPLEAEESELVRLAVSLEALSSHPLSAAITAYGESEGVSVISASDFRSFGGKGVSAVIGGKTVCGGNRRFMSEIGVDVSSCLDKAEKLAEQGKTPLFFTCDGKLLGIIAAADRIKPDSRMAIEAMKKDGIEVVMLTGDNAKTAEAVRKELGIDRIAAEVMPEDKAQEAMRLRSEGKLTAMIGDGINDSPALASADVGIAIGAGADIAIEAADVVLMKNSLADAVTAYRLSRAVMRNIRQNLFWAFFYNIIGIPIAAGVLFVPFAIKLNPMLGAAAMSLSSVCVVTNALRLRAFKPPVFESDSLSPQAEALLNKEDGNMKKIMTVDGMSCEHCKASVEKALMGVSGVNKAIVDLKKKTAVISLTGDVADSELQKAVNEAGFTAGAVEVKKGLFN